MTFGEKLKNAREQLILSQRELSQELGLTVATICRLETGKMEPRITTKRKVVEYFKKHGIDFQL